jgi:hypothetical protein
MKYGGGPLALAPRVHTVSFDWDDNAANEQQFDDMVIASDYWKTVTAGYCDAAGACIGAGQSAGHSVLHQTAAMLDTFVLTGDFEAQVLAPALAQGQLPPPEAGLVYMFYFPADSPLAGQLASGLHETIRLADAHGTLGSTVSYAVTKGWASSVAAHELVEIATDLLAGTARHGWTMPDEAFKTFFHGEEVADVCNLDSDVHTGAWSMPRIWSNASARDGHNPCVPVPHGEVYFNVAPETQVVHLDVGQTIQVRGVAFSDAPLPEGWTLDMNGDSALGLEVAPRRVHNGDIVTITVTLNSQPIIRPDGPPTFAVVSMAVGGGHYPPPGADSTSFTTSFSWPVAVSTQ